MATVSNFMVERLVEDWGVSRIFGFPGDGINGMFSAIREIGPERLEFVQVRHEEMAAFMACAHAKFTGETGVCISTSGPGAIHLLNGLYDAKLDHQPVVAIIGQQARSAIGGSYQQEVDLHGLFKDVSEYVITVEVPTQARHAIDRAMRIAQVSRSVCTVILPNDLQELDAEAPPNQHGTIHSSSDYAAPLVVAQDVDLKRAADVLNSGTKVAMLVGAGAKGATAEVLEVAELLGAGIAKALLGKSAVPDDIEFVTGSIGLLGTKASWELMQDCDTLLIVGSSFPYSEFLPPEGAARAVQIDIDGRMLGLRYPTEVNLQGDSATTLRALLPLLRRVEDRSWREQVVENVADWWKVVDARAQTEADPVNPQFVFSELSTRLPDRAILTSDSGSSANWYARNVKLRAGMDASLSGNLATMGPGVPYAIAAKFAFPDRPVIALVGDGAMQMNGTSELLTVAKYHERWSDQRFVVLVLNNEDLNQVTWEQRAMLGDPKYEASQDIPAFDYAAFARSIGLHGVRVEQPGDVGAAWDEVLSCGMPAVLDVRTDPEVPPLPPHITFEQAKAFMSSLVQDPSRGQMIAQSAKQVMKSVLPGRD